VRRFESTADKSRTTVIAYGLSAILVMATITWLVMAFGAPVGVAGGLVLAAAAAGRRPSSVVAPARRSSPQASSARRGRTIA